METGWVGLAESIFVRRKLLIDSSTWGISLHVQNMLIAARKARFALR